MTALLRRWKRSCLHPRRCLTAHIPSTPHSLETLDLSCLLRSKDGWNVIVNDETEVSFNRSCSVRLQTCRPSLELRLRLDQLNDLLSKPPPSPDEPPPSLIE